MGVLSMTDFHLKTSTNRGFNESKKLQNVYYHLSIQLFLDWVPAGRLVAQFSLRVQLTKLKLNELMTRRLLICPWPELGKM